MQILLANPRGFCAGVDRAIDIVERAHRAVRRADLRAPRGGAQPPRGRAPARAGRGVRRGAGRGAGRRHRDLLRARRVERGRGARRARRGLQVFDATCPLVTKVHLEVARYAREARDVVLIGHAGHPEVEGTMGRFDARMAAASTWSRTSAMSRGSQVRDPARLAFVTQTTLSVDDTAGDRRGAARALPGAAGAAQGGHLLRHAEPPGRGEAAAGANATCWWWWARRPAPIPTACASWPTAPACPATWSMAPTTCSASGSRAQGASASRPAPRRRRCWCSRWSSACASWGGEAPREMRGARGERGVQPAAAAAADAASK